MAIVTDHVAIYNRIELYSRIKSKFPVILHEKKATLSAIFRDQGNETPELRLRKMVQNLQTNVTPSDGRNVYF